MKKKYSFKSYPITGLHKLVGLQESEAPRVSRHQYMQVIKLSALLVCYLWRQEMFLLLIPVKG